MPREVNLRAVRKAQDVLDRGGTQGEAGEAADVDDRTIRTWLGRGILRPADVSPEDPDPTEGEAETHKADLSGSNAGSFHRTDPDPGSPSHPPASARREEPGDGRAAASRAAAQAARARVEEAEETLREKKAARALRRFEEEEAEETTRRAREDAARRERVERLAAEAAAAAMEQAAARRRAEEDRAERCRAEGWRREELPVLVAVHVPSEASPAERAAAVEALRDLLASTGPDDPPSEAAIVAALLVPLAPCHDRAAARRSQEVVGARCEEAVSRLRARFHHSTAHDEAVKAEAALRTRCRSEPDGDFEAFVREVGDDTRAAVAARVRGECVARQVREAAEAREREARSLLRIGLPLGASSDEREEAEAHLDQRLRECAEETPRELVAAVLAPLRAAVERRAERARLAAAKVEMDREAADEKARRRAEWERAAEGRFQELFHEVVEEEREALREQEAEDGTLDAASEKYASSVRFLSEYELVPEFHAALRSLRTGANVDEAAARILESHLLILWEKAEREVRRGGA